MYNAQTPFVFLPFSEMFGSKFPWGKKMSLDPNFHMLKGGGGGGQGTTSDF